MTGEKDALMRCQETNRVGCRSPRLPPCSTPAALFHPLSVLDNKFWHVLASCSSQQANIRGSKRNNVRLFLLFG